MINKILLDKQLFIKSVESIDISVGKASRVFTDSVINNNNKVNKKEVLKHFNCIVDTLKLLVNDATKKNS